MSKIEECYHMRYKMGCANCERIVIKHKWQIIERQNKEIKQQELLDLKRRRIKEQ